MNSDAPSGSPMRRIGLLRAIPDDRRRFKVLTNAMLRSAGTERQGAGGISHGRQSLDSLELQRSVPKLENRAGAWPGRDARRGNLVRCLRAHAAERPDDAAFVGLNDDPSRHTTMTYGELDRRARAVAAFLQDRRLAGERVVLAYPPGLEFIAAFFGVLYAGCVAVPTYPPRRRTLDRFDAIAKDAGAPVALSTASSIAQFNAMTGRGAAIRWHATDDLADADADRWLEHDPARDSLAMIQYTSGSTSRPKGVMLSHGNLVANTRAISQSFEVQSNTAGVFWLPAYHDMGLIGGVLAPVFSGVTNIIMAPAMFLQNPFLWLDAISKSRATTSGGPNFAYDLCVRKIGAEQRATLDLSSWSLAFIGAEAVQPETLARFTEAFAPCGFSPESFYPCYGLAEATLIVTGPKSGAGAAVRGFRDDALAQNRVEPLPDNAPNARRLVGCGAPVNSAAIVIIDPETLAPIAPDRVGEIWVGGESVGQGYWCDPKKTAATFHARRSDTGEGPFLRTGDLGFVHESQLYITGRVDDLIIVRGLNHHPQDIEATARECHPLLEAGLGAAFAIDDDGAQRLVLVHEVERDGSSDLAPVLDAVHEAVLDEHGLALDAVVLIRCGTIAKTSSGKVQRHASRAAFLADELKPLTQRHRQPMPTSSVPAQSAALAAVCQHALAMSGTVLADVTPETSIAALGLDSLQRVELVAALDQSFGRHLPDTVYSQATTLGDLANAVQKHLIDHPQTDAPAREIPAENYDVALFPEYLELKRHERMVVAVAESNPYFRVDHGTDLPTPAAGALAHIDGHVLTNFCAYDYVSMAHDPTVSAATKAAIDRYGTGAGASRLVSGEKQIHGELESALAEFLGTPAAIVFVSGHATNVTTIGHLMGPGDLIVHDILAHNSILQGARLSGATSRGFAHNDWRALDTLLSDIRHDFRRVLIAIEAVYSMDGDFPDLARFVDVKAKHRAMLLVDEAHSLGTMGRTGRGIGEHASIDRTDVELWMGTLSKSLASCGGYIAGSAELIEYLKYTAPGFVYSVGISPPNAATALAALTLLRREPQRVTRLHALSSLFLGLARERGLDTGRAGGTPVIPVIIGNSVKCLLLSRALFRRGINVQPIINPAVPEHATRLRLFITTNHTESQVRSTVDAVVEELAKL
jgi:8-amino-7-oxononanoate synthase